MVSLSVSVARVECVGVVHLSSVCLSVCLSVCVCLCTYGLSDPALQNLQMSFANSPAPTGVSFDRRAVLA